LAGQAVFSSKEIFAREEIPSLGCRQGPKRGEAQNMKLTLFRAILLLKLFGGGVILGQCGLCR
jgi:hypothetical protein